MSVLDRVQFRSCKYIQMIAAWARSWVFAMGDGTAAFLLAALALLVLHFNEPVDAVYFYFDIYIET